MSFELGTPVSPEAFLENKVLALVHCAYDFHPNNWRDIRRINVEGSEKLLRAAKQGGVKKLIFISSISAFDGCISMYGRAKREAELMAPSLGAVVIRPGLIYGDSGSGGMFGSLQRAVTRSSFVPLIGGGKYLQYLVHEDDLTEVIFRAACGEVAEGLPISVASPRPWSLRELLAAIVDERGAEVRFIPVPWRAVWTGARTLEILKLPTPFRSDSVVSLVHQNPSPDFSYIQKMGWEVREFGAKSSSGTPAICNNGRCWIKS